MKLRMMIAIVSAGVVGMIGGIAGMIGGDLVTKTRIEKRDHTLPWSNVESWNDPATGSEWMIIMSGSRVISMFPRVCQDGAPATRLDDQTLFCPDSK